MPKNCKSAWSPDGRSALYPGDSARSTGALADINNYSHKDGCYRDAIVDFSSSWDFFDAIGDKLPDGEKLSPSDFGQLFARQPSTTLMNDLASRLD